MNLRNILSLLSLLCFVMKTFGTSDTICLRLDDSKNNLMHDTIYADNGDWTTYEIDISSVKRDSICSVVFDPYHTSQQVGSFYIRKITVSNDTNSVVVEDFEDYDPDTIGSQKLFSTDDRRWNCEWVWDGSKVYATIPQGNNRYMQCFYYTGKGEVGSILLLTFTPDTKDWTDYTTLCFSIADDEPTNIKNDNNMIFRQENVTCYYNTHGLFIKFTGIDKSENYYLFSMSGKLLRHISPAQCSSFLWQMPKLSHGNFILRGDNGSTQFSQMITISE